MKKYIRCCLSLDQATKDKLEKLTKYFNNSNSGIVKMAINQIWNEVKLNND